MGPDMTGVLEVEVEASDQHTRGMANMHVELL